VSTNSDSFFLALVKRHVALVELRLVQIALDLLGKVRVVYIDLPLMKSFIGDAGFVELVSE